MQVMGIIKGGKILLKYRCKECNDLVQESHFQFEEFSMSELCEKCSAAKGKIKPARLLISRGAE